jgi:integrase/recombinase XerD
MATASIFIDKYHPQINGKCTVSLRVTHQQKKKYYPTGIRLTVKEFERVMKAKRRSVEESDVYRKLLEFQAKANSVIDKLPHFTFNQFEEGFISNRKMSDSLTDAFDNYINELKDGDKIGTAVAYECARNSIIGFKKDLRIADITPKFLQKYEDWMLGQENSITTVSIYLRCLRAILNRSNVDRLVYPFGKSKDKYSIPTGKNIKKALTLDEVSKIFNYDADPKSSEQMARDYWIFMYLSNGMNVKDICLLKWKNIDKNILKYSRSKTKSTKNSEEQIKISLKSEAKAIIQKWGRPSDDRDDYIFPHLEQGMTAVRQRQVYQQLTKTINKYMKRIAVALQIDKEITTYYARHSFATVLKRSGATTEFISEMLGHADSKTTRSYLDSFEDEEIHSRTDVLTKGFSDRIKQKQNETI